MAQSNTLFIRKLSTGSTGVKSYRAGFPSDFSGFAGLGIQGNFCWVVLWENFVVSRCTCSASSQVLTAHRCIDLERVTNSRRFSVSTAFMLLAKQWVMKIRLERMQIRWGLIKWIVQYKGISKSSVKMGRSSDKQHEVCVGRGQVRKTGSVHT